MDEKVENMKNWDENSASSEGYARYQHPNKEVSTHSSVSEYNEKEIQYLDKYLPEVENAFDVMIILIFRNQNFTT